MKEVCENNWATPFKKFKHILRLWSSLFKTYSAKILPPEPVNVCRQMFTGCCLQEWDSETNYMLSNWRILKILSWDTIKKKETVLHYILKQKSILQKHY